VTNAHEAFGQDMQQQAAQELLRGNRHDLGAMVVRVVFPPERHPVAVHRHQPRIGDGDPVRITPQIAKHLRDAAKRPLGVDDPVLAIQLLEQELKRSGIPQMPDAAGERELPGLVGLLQTGQKLAAEQLAEDLDRQQVSAPTGNPTLPVER